MSFTTHRGIQASKFQNKLTLIENTISEDRGVTSEVENSRRDVWFAFLSGSGLKPQGEKEDISLAESLFRKVEDLQIVIRFSQTLLNLFNGSNVLVFVISNKTYQLIDFSHVDHQKVYIALNLKRTQVGG